MGASILFLLESHSIGPGATNLELRFKSLSLIKETPLRFGLDPDALILRDRRKRSCCPPERIVFKAPTRQMLLAKGAFCGRSLAWALTALPLERNLFHRAN